jgi:hypothetical protein
MTITLKKATNYPLERPPKHQLANLQSKIVSLILLLKKCFPFINNGLKRIFSQQLFLLEKAEILSDATSFQKTAIVLAAFKIGLFDYLNNQSETTSEQIANDLQLHPISTERLLSALENLGYLNTIQKEDKFYYYNSSLASNYMVQESPAYLGNYYQIVDKNWSAWQALDMTIQSGMPNKTMDLFQGDKETLYQYYVFANEYLKEPTRELLNQVPLDKVNRMIAGEVGITFISELLHHKPNLEFVLAGLENQIDFLDKLLLKYPLPKPPEEIVTSPLGNALFDKWGSKEKYDLVFLFRKLAYSDYGMQFLKKSFEVLSPGGMVIVLEPTTDSFVPSLSFLPELEMMDLLIGGVKAPPLYSTDQIVNLIKKVGFIKTKVLSTHQKSFIFVIGWKKE